MITVTVVMGTMLMMFSEFDVVLRGSVNWREVLIHHYFSLPLQTAQFKTRTYVGRVTETVSTVNVSFGMNPLTFTLIVFRRYKFEFRNVISPGM